MHGYEIVIEEPAEGKIVVQALKDGEVVEEFELEGGEDHPGREEEMNDDEMSAFGEEETDLGDEEESDEMGEEEMGGEEEEEEEMPSEEEGALESFSSYFNKSKRINESKKTAAKKTVSKTRRK